MRRMFTNGSKHLQRRRHGSRQWLLCDSGSFHISGVSVGLRGRSNTRAVQLLLRLQADFPEAR